VAREQRKLAAILAADVVGYSLCVPKIRFDVDSGNTRGKLVA
jgi:hypothetical protein